MQQQQQQQTAPMFVKKFELGLQERIDTGLMPAFYNVVNIYASSLANLKGETDIAPVLISRFMTGFVRHKKEVLIDDEEERVESRINKIKESNGGTISNAERGQIRLEESVETATQTIAIFDEQHEQRQCIGLILSPKDMKGLRSPPAILNLNKCESKIREMGIPIVESRKMVDANEDVYDEEVED